MLRSGPDPRLEELASQMSALEPVEAVILGGSISTGLNDERSDYDLYVYTRQPVEVTVR
jgi:predicted nucleotidyltransferase